MPVPHGTLDEYFEIKLTNQKAQPVTVNVLEHLYRGDNWEIMQKSADYTKLDSHTIQFPVQVPANIVYRAEGPKGPWLWSLFRRKGPQKSDFAAD